MPNFIKIGQPIQYFKAKKSSNQVNEGYQIAQNIGVSWYEWRISWRQVHPWLWSYPGGTVYIFTLVQDWRFYLLFSSFYHNSTFGMDWLWTPEWCTSTWNDHHGIRVRNENMWWNSCKRRYIFWAKFLFLFYFYYFKIKFFILIKNIREQRSNCRAVPGGARGLESGLWSGAE